MRGDPTSPHVTRGTARLVWMGRTFCRLRLRTEGGNIMRAISRKVGELGAAIGLLAIGFQGCSANDERTGGSEEDVATTEEALTKNIHWCAQYEAEAMTR